jgi:hypothetical protein
MLKVYILLQQTYLVSNICILLFALDMENVYYSYLKILAF